MSTAINPSQGAQGRPGSLRSIFSRDDQALAEKQSTTFDQLLAGFDWKPIEVAEDTTNEADSEEVAEVDSGAKPESTEKKEEETSETTEAEVVATEEVLLQAEVVATIQSTQKNDAPIEQAAAVNESGDGKEVVEVVEATSVDDLAAQAVVVKTDDKPIEVEQQTDDESVKEVVQIDPRVREHKDRRRKDDAVNKTDGGAKTGPVVAQNQQQVKVEAKKEVKPEHQELVQGAPTQNLDEVRTNRRSRKERLADRAENPRGEAWQQGSPDEISDRPIGQKPDVSIKPPEQPLATQALDSSLNTPQVIAAPAPQAPVATSNATEVRASERAQGVNGVQNNSNNSAQRTEGSRESTSRADEAQKNANAKKTEEKSAVDQRQQIRLIQRVARGFERIGDQGGNIRLRLHPPELGSLAMTVRVEGKTLSAEIVTETVQARQALVDNLPQLKQQLADNGLTIEKFDVRVMDQQASFSGQTFSGQSSQQNSSQSSGSWNQPSGRRSETQRVAAGRNTSFEPIGATSYSSGAGGTRTLDVQV